MRHKKWLFLLEILDYPGHGSRQGSPFLPKQGSDPEQPNNTNPHPSPGRASVPHPGTSVLKDKGPLGPGPWCTGQSAYPTHPASAGTGGWWKEIYIKYMHIPIIGHRNISIFFIYIKCFYILISAIFIYIYTFIVYYINIYLKINISCNLYV